MITSTRPAPNVRRLPVFGIVAVLASAAIAGLIATDLVNPYPTQKAAYLTCAVLACSGLIQCGYSLAIAKNS